MWGKLLPFIKPGNLCEIVHSNSFPWTMHTICLFNCNFKRKHLPIIFFHLSKVQESLPCRVYLSLPRPGDKQFYHLYRQNHNLLFLLTVLPFWVPREENAINLSPPPVEWGMTVALLIIFCIKVFKLHQTWVKMSHSYVK